MKTSHQYISGKIPDTGFRQILIFVFFAFMLQQNLTVAASPIEFNGDQKELIIEINKFTYTIANQHDQFYSFIGVRALAMVHLAIHDIYNANEAQYQPYLLTTKINAKFNPGIAAISATRTILKKAYAERKDTIDQTCDQWLATLADTSFKATSVDLGNMVAQLYILHRANDGHQKNGDYTPMTKPGDYQYTPGFDYVWKPDFSVARPFTLDSVSQLRCPPPPELTSETYAASYNEVKAYGVKNSSTRSEDQTSFGHWWAEFGEHGWNRIGRIVAQSHDLSATEANRMFALLNMNLYDLYLVSFDSKYTYDTWRPYTAIHNGESDNNPATQGQADWEPEMVTPPWPEYPSAHASVGAAGAEIVSQVLGTPKVTFTMQSTTALPSQPERTYHNLDDAANDCADSRIMNGYHFRFATEEGKRQGRALAKHTMSGFLGKR